jgi:hypothetical protein
VYPKRPKAKQQNRDERFLSLFSATWTFAPCASQDGIAMKLPALFLYDPRPIRVCLPQISLRVLAEIFPNTQTVLKQETPVDDLKSIRIDRGRIASGDCPRTESAELRLVFEGIGFEVGFILSGCEIVGNPIGTALKLRAAFDRSIFDKVGNGIVPPNTHTILIDVQESFRECR